MVDLPFAWIPKLTAEEAAEATFFGVERFDLKPPEPGFKEVMQKALDDHYRYASRLLGIHLYGDPLYPRCYVPYAGWCPNSILDSWDAYDDESVEPDTICLCEGGVCR